MNRYTYLGVDETSLGVSNDSLIVVTAESQSPYLAQDMGYGALSKAKDILEEARAYDRECETLDYANMPDLPAPHEMSGMQQFHWTRASGGRFSRQLIEHASIAQVVASNGYRPERTVLCIDSFHMRGDESRRIITEYLHREQFNISEKNIEMVPGGDRRVPLINYADLLAFQIGLWMNERYREFNPHYKKFPIQPHEVEYDERRVSAHEDRERLERILEACRRPGG